MHCATGFLNTYPLDSDLSGGISYAGRHLLRFWTRFNGFILMWQATAIFENPNVILKILLNPSDSFFLLTRRSLYSMFALRLANFAMKLLWIIWNSTYKFCWNDFNNALTKKLKYCCSFRFTKKLPFRLWRISLSYHVFEPRFYDPSRFFWPSRVTFGFG